MTQCESPSAGQRPCRLRFTEAPSKSWGSRIGESIRRPVRLAADRRIGDRVVLERGPRCADRAVAARRRCADHRCRRRTRRSRAMRASSFTSAAQMKRSCTRAIHNSPSRPTARARSMVEHDQWRRHHESTKKFSIARARDQRPPGRPQLVLALAGRHGSARRRAAASGRATLPAHSTSLHIRQPDACRARCRIPGNSSSPATPLGSQAMAQPVQIHAARSVGAPVARRCGASG